MPTPTLAVVAPSETTGSDVVPTEAIVPPPSPPVATVDPSSPARFTLSAVPGVPPALIDAAREAAANNSQQFQWVDHDPAADVLLTINDGAPLAHWLYVVAAPFATVTDGTTWPAVTAGWSSGT
ncbi:MAG: hypothetical protein DCC51_10695, partial [Anaerolineae bacterium]